MRDKADEIEEWHESYNGQEESIRRLRATLDDVQVLPSEWREAVASDCIGDAALICADELEAILEARLNEPVD